MKFDFADYPIFIAADIENDAFFENVGVIEGLAKRRKIIPIAGLTWRIHSRIAVSDSGLCLTYSLIRLSLMILIIFRPSKNEL